MPVAADCFRLLLIVIYWFIAGYMALSFFAFDIFPHVLSFSPPRRHY
jgi:hypothetical protein